LKIKNAADDNCEVTSGSLIVVHGVWFDIKPMNIVVLETLKVVFYMIEKMTLTFVKTVL